MSESDRAPPAVLVIADQLDQLAKRELDEVKQFLRTVRPIQCAMLLIEACRCIDHIHVIQSFSQNDKAKLAVQDFDILVRGWNVLFGLLMQRMGGFAGVPLSASEPELRHSVVGMMHFAGRFVLLSRTAEMVRHGMVTATADGDDIQLELSKRTLLDHFHDQVDRGKLAELDANLLERHRPAPKNTKSVEQFRDLMGKLTFPWETPQGVMVGYSADPEIDAYFLNAVVEDTLQWRDDAGIHPRAKLGDCTGEQLIAIVQVLMSFHVKHIMFVEEAIKRHPGVNQHMSLTIWKTRAELIESLIAVTGISEGAVSAALDLITVRVSDANYFLTEQAPGIPLVIELCDGYLLTPVSGVFRNPFNKIRMLRESTSASLQNAFREHREEWMAEDLYALFGGPRFQCVAGQTKLRRNGQVVTDLDAAIFDNATGDLVLFQLKWQDFTSSSIRTQLSKAKNFVEQVELWAKKTSIWIDEFGVLALCRALKIKLPDKTMPRCVRLNALGRSNARFRSYGYNTGHDVLVLPWSQFVRLRLMIGRGQDFFSLLAQAVVDEAELAVDRSPLPYVLERHGVKITFKDTWNVLAEARGRG